MRAELGHGLVKLTCSVSRRVTSHQEFRVCRSCVRDVGMAMIILSIIRKIEPRNEDWRLDIVGHDLVLLYERHRCFPGRSMKRNSILIGGPRSTLKLTLDESEDFDAVIG